MLETVGDRSNRVSNHELLFLLTRSKQQRSIVIKRLFFSLSLVDLRNCHEMNKLMRNFETSRLQQPRREPFSYTHTYSNKPNQRVIRDLILLHVSDRQTNASQFRSLFTRKVCRFTLHPEWDIATFVSLLRKRRSNYSFASSSQFDADHAESSQFCSVESCSLSCSTLMCDACWEVDIVFFLGFCEHLSSIDSTWMLNCFSSLGFDEKASCFNIN